MAEPASGEQEAPARMLAHTHARLYCNSALFNNIGAEACTVLA